MTDRPASTMTSRTHAGSMGRAPASGDTPPPASAERDPAERGSRADRIAGREPASVGGQDVMRGIRAGLIGSVVVALFFGVIDLALGRPFWTPMLLGSVLFQDELVAPDVAISAPIVAGYTILHAAAFVVAGLGASRAIAFRRRTIRPLTALGYVAALFVFLEVVFLLFARMTEPQLLGAVGTGRVAVANLLSALAITADLMWTRPRSGEREPETADRGVTPA